MSVKDSFLAVWLAPENNLYAQLAGQEFFPSNLAHPRKMRDDAGAEHEVEETQEVRGWEHFLRHARVSGIPLGAKSGVFEAQGFFEWNFVRHIYTGRQAGRQTDRQTDTDTDTDTDTHIVNWNS